MSRGFTVFKASHQNSQHVTALTNNTVYPGLFKTFFIWVQVTPSYSISVVLNMY